MSVATSVEISAIISANVTVLGTGPSMSVTDIGTNQYRRDQSRRETIVIIIIQVPGGHPATVPCITGDCN
eukprot:10494058-Karenia_brevis.AAC.1